MSQSYLYLGIAIAAEVVATSFLKSAEGFTRLWPSLIVAAGYAIAFVCLSLALRTIPTGVGQKLDAPALIGMALILAGVLVINLFSRTAGH